MKKFFYLLIILGLLIVGLYLLPDEALQPEVENWLQVEKPTLPPAQNGFFTLVGLFAAASDDPHTVGVEAVATIEKVFAQKGTFEAYPDHHLDISDKIKESLCDVTKTACLDNFATQADVIKQIIADHQVLMDRYQTLYAIEGYQDDLLPSTPDMPIPSFGSLMRLNQLRVAEIGVEYMTGEKTKAIESLQQDMKFIRFLLANTRMLITKMIARKMLATDLHLYAQMLDAEIPFSSDVMALADNLPSLSMTERSFETVMRYEFQMMTHFLLNLSNKSWQEKWEEFQDGGYEEGLFLWTLSFWTLKPNATVNHTYRQIKQIVDLSRLPTTEYLSNKDEFAEEKPGIWDYLYNGVGTLLNNEIPSYSRYASGLIDLEGLIRLVRLKAHVRSQEIKKSEMTEFLAVNAENYGNPYTGEPMLWDAERKMLYFKSPEETNHPYYRELSLAL